MIEQEALIIHLLGRKIGYNTLDLRIRQVLEVSSNLDLIDLGHNYYLVRLDEPADTMKALTEGPRVIANHYLRVSRWVQDFIPSRAKSHAMGGLLFVEPSTSGGPR